MIKLRTTMTLEVMKKLDYGENVAKAQLLTFLYMLVQKGLALTASISI